MTTTAPGEDAPSGAPGRPEARLVTAVLAGTAAAAALSTTTGVEPVPAAAWLCVPVALFASRSTTGGRTAAACAAALTAAVSLIADGTLRSGVLVVTVLLLVAVGETVARVVDRIRTADRAVLASLRTERSRALEAVAERDVLAVRLAYQAEHDVLTGLPNRSAFLAHLRDALSGDRAVGVLFIDLDDFKVVNDTFGHAAGDELLVGVAERLRNALRTGDVVARFGGDEFAVLLTGQDSSDLAVGIAARLLGILRAPFAISAGMASGQASGGLVHEGRRPQVSVDEQAGELMRKADLAMYAAKAEGGGRCVPFVAQMQDTMSARRVLRDDLRRALIEDELVLHYQPVIDLRTGRTVAVEALARWPHPTKGDIPPSVFIPVAEESGAIVDLGMWVLEQACLDVQLWDELCPGNDLSVSVNLSARQLREPAVGPQVARVLHRRGVDPRRLVLEVTESLLMEDGEAAAATLWQLRGLGIRIAVDDFGTGYSSLSRLVDLPLDDLKIDRAFVAELDRSGAGATIVKAAIAMAHGLDLTVVAEGVETEEQLAFLTEEGCDRAQGHVFSRPVPMDAITGLLRRGGTAPQRTAPHRPAPMPGPRPESVTLRSRPTSTALPAKHKHR